MGYGIQVATGDEITAAKMNAKLENIESSDIPADTITNGMIVDSTIDVVHKITGLVPVANLGLGSATTNTFLRGDQAWTSIPSPVFSVTNVTGATYAVLSTDDVIRVNAALCTVTLPSATGTGRRIYVKNIHSTGVVTVTAAAGQFIDAEQTMILDSQYTSITLIDAASGVWDME